MRCFRRAEELFAASGQVAPLAVERRLVIVQVFLGEILPQGTLPTGSQMLNRYYIAA